MELITILVIIVSVFTVFSGVTVFAGAEKSTKLKALTFLLTTIFAVIWAFSVIVFLNLRTSSESFAQCIVLAIYIAPLLMMLCQVFYTGWNYLPCKILGIIYGILSAVFIIFMITDHAEFYSGIILADSGNNIEIVNKWLYVYYFALIIIMLTTFVWAALHTSRVAKTKRVRQGNLFFAIGLFITGGMAVIFNLILPVYGNYSLAYIGPLTLSIAVILHFYAILKYRLVILSSTWLKLGSYVMLMSMTAIVYMLIFSLIFSVLFKVRGLSTEVIVMNFIMIVIVLLILPVFNEISGFIKSLISVQQINMEFVIKKLNKMATQNVDFDALAVFLADNLHFKYIGLVVDDKLYGSDELAISKEELEEISMLEAGGRNIWQKIEGPSKQILAEKQIVAVAELRNAKGRPFGQILVGQPLGKVSFEKRDLMQLEMIMNLVASIIDSEERLKV